MYAQQRTVRTPYVVVGVDGSEQARAALHWADLLVVGASGSNALTRLLIGSTSAYGAQRAGCPVLVSRTERPAASSIAEPLAVLELSHS